MFPKAILWFLVFFLGFQMAFFMVLGVMFWVLWAHGHFVGCMGVLPGSLGHFSGTPGPYFSTHFEKKNLFQMFPNRETNANLLNPYFGEMREIKKIAREEYFE